MEWEVQTSGCNKQDSFSWVTMRGRRGRVVNIVTCCRVSQDSGASIVEGTYFIQQETILRKAKITESPREHCINELIKFITKATLAREEVILSMDANEPMHGPRNGIQKLLSATVMVDAIAQFHGDEIPKNVSPRKEPN